MYKTQGPNSGHSKPFGRRSSFVRKPFNSRSGGGRPSFGGNSSRGNSSRRGPKKDFINESLFINKATEVKVEEYKPKHVFADFGLAEKLLNNLAKKGFVHPSPIQDQAIPVALSGCDVIGIANTGTGKTAAFLLPIINKLVADHNHKALILAPTRELAQQVEAEFRVFTQGMKLFSVSCVGGAPIGKQMRELELGVHIVIGTPGRVKDLIARGKIATNLFGTIVLDEADRMLDMGFIDDIKLILSGLPKERQGLFFSATFPPAIKGLCVNFLKDPVTISVKTRDTSSAVDQDIVRVRAPQKKIEVLHDILNDPLCAKVLIFREMKRSVDELERELVGRGFKALGLHGDMRNRERERAVKALAQGSVQIVIATDVAARGIDIPDITHVINYDTPGTYDTYVHRIGRTGRASSKGKALTFV